MEALQQQGAEVVLLCVDGEPDLAFVSGGADLARRRTIDVVIGIGGGSALDAAKAIAALATNAGDPLDYLEVVGSGKAIVQRSASAHRRADDGRHRVRGHQERGADGARPRGSRRASAAR